MPKTYKTEIIGYRFEELSDDIKQELYQRDYDSFAEMVEFEPIEESFKEIIVERYGAELDDEYFLLWYDVSYTQGSGASCTVDLDVDTVLSKLLDGSQYDGSLPAKLHFVSEQRKKGNIDIPEIRVVRCGPSNFYNHENTCRVEVIYNNNIESAVAAQDLDEAIEHIEEHLTERIRELLIEFHGNLQEYYEESSSFEAYYNVLSDSDNVYTVTGSIIDPTFIKNAYVIDAVQLSLDFDDQEDYSFT